MKSRHLSVDLFILVLAALVLQKKQKSRVSMMKNPEEETDKKCRRMQKPWLIMQKVLYFYISWYIFF
jgi:hypothetical protein